MTRLALLTLVLTQVQACASRTRARVNQAALGLAVATIACDWGQTHAAAKSGWFATPAHYEMNPVIGPDPTVRAVDLYMLGAAIAIVAVGQHLPSWLRAPAYGLVAVVEAKTLVDNVEIGMPHATTCGMGGRL